MNNIQKQEYKESISNKSTDELIELLIQIEKEYEENEKKSTDLHDKYEKLKSMERTLRLSFILQPKVQEVSLVAKIMDYTQDLENEKYDRTVDMLNGVKCICEDKWVLIAIKLGRANAFGFVTYDDEFDDDYDDELTLLRHDIIVYDYGDVEYMLTTDKDPQDCPEELIKGSKRFLETRSSEDSD